MALTHWGRDEIGAILQTTFSNAFSWMKMSWFRLKCHWVLFTINNSLVLVQIMAWRRPGDKPLSEPMMIILLTHIWVKQPHWVLITVKLPGVGVAKPISSVPIFYQFFCIVKTYVSYWIARLFDMCLCCSSAAVPPVKCECDSTNLTPTLVKSKIFLTWELLKLRFLIYL